MTIFFRGAARSSDMADMEKRRTEKRTLPQTISAGRAAFVAQIAAAAAVPTLADDFQQSRTNKTLSKRRADNAGNLLRLFSCLYFKLKHST